MAQVNNRNSQPNNNANFSEDFEVKSVRASPQNDVRPEDYPDPDE